MRMVDEQFAGAGVPAGVGVFGAAVGFGGSGAAVFTGGSGVGGFDSGGGGGAAWLIVTAEAALPDVAGRAAGVATATTSGSRVGRTIGIIASGCSSYQPR